MGESKTKEADCLDSEPGPAAEGGGRANGMNDEQCAAYHFNKFSKWADNNGSEE